MPRLPTSKHALGDAPIEDAYREKMNLMAQGLDRALNGPLVGIPGTTRETGFVLMVFPYGNRTGRCNYISNGADRNDVVTLMREMIARFESQPESKEGTA